MRFLSFLFALNLLMFSGVDVIAEEELICSEEGNCELSLQQKVKLSYADAFLVVSGSFEKTSNAKLEKFADDSAFMDVVFKVDRYLKGAAQATSFNFKLPVYTRDIQSNGKESKLLVSGNYTSTLRYLEKLEQQLESGDIAKNDYQKKLDAYRSKLEVSDEQVLKGAFIVPVRPGGLDYSHRVADVPVDYSRKYILFIYTGLPAFDNKFLMSSNLDLYPQEGRADLDRLLAM
ncbi:hypothetical protein G8764_10050 [Pseudomaricurvus alcaniphilus]|uniref:hypothetical protein n=1 Tax=Pseudomaricurvus alcaniphilus TaxID=1166482 RepID=UPI00140BE3C1|nr:hypothetical protein [Pseudomaricurvus alcaniphilus]NHN37635.1 hypothetical protein [Pseudomaricurvus alcaniphilus]